MKKKRNSSPGVCDRGASQPFSMHSIVYGAIAGAMAQNTPFAAQYPLCGTAQLLYPRILPTQAMGFILIRIGDES